MTNCNGAHRPGIVLRGLAAFAGAVEEARSERAWNAARSRGEGYWDQD